MALKLFSGSANQELSKNIASVLKTDLAKVEITRFANSEVRVRVEEDVKHDVCVVIQSTSNPTDTHLMELYLMCDALRRQEARRVIGVIPYFGYARQDIQHRPGECVSSNVVIRFLEAIGFYKIYTVNLHDEATEGVFSIPFKNLSALPLIADRIHEDLQNKNKQVDQEHVAIVSPDQGGIERTRKFGAQFFGTWEFELAVAEKRRNLEVIHQSKALDLYGDVKGKIAIIVDDVATSGSTLINAAEFCLAEGATSVVAAIAHRDFAEGTPQKIQSSVIESFYTTDSIAILETQQFEKMKTVSIAGLIGQELADLRLVQKNP